MMPLGNPIDPAFQMGTREHAERLTLKRHPGVVAALQWLAFSHLPEELQRFSRPFYQTAAELVVEIQVDSPELTTTLNTLVDAKDWAVRAGIRATYGRPGPVARPGTVVNPPTVFETRPVLEGP